MNSIENVNHNIKRELKPVSKNNLLNKIMYKSHKNCSETIKRRINDIILSLLIKDNEAVKKYSFEGLPDEMPLLRSLVWKINMKYLSINLEKWDDYLVKKRADYSDLKDAFLNKLKFEYQALLDNKNDMINLSDLKLIEYIEKDIKRTHVYMNFFFMPSKKSVNVSNEEIAKNMEKRKENFNGVNIEDIYKKNHNEWETNADVMGRILYIYAKLNSDIGYVQGMNEILAPIYYCFFSEEENSLIYPGMDDIDIQKEHDYQFIVDVEADAFWTFSSLMEDLKLLYIKDKDKESGGIFDKLSTLSEMLKIVDKDLFNHFHKIKLDVQLFAFKWVVLLFTQDFNMPDILRLWDAILSENNRFYMIFLLCLSILKLKRKELLKADFSISINILSKIGNVDCEIVLKTSIDIRTKYEKKLLKLLSNSK